MAMTWYYHAIRNFFVVEITKKCDIWRYFSFLSFWVIWIICEVIPQHASCNFNIKLIFISLVIWFISQLNLLIPILKSSYYFIVLNFVIIISLSLNLSILLIFLLASWCCTISKLNLDGEHVLKLPQ